MAPRLFDEVVCLIEEFVQFILFMVFSRQVEVVGDVLPTVLHESTTGDGQNGLDSLVWVRISYFVEG
jgi:hypothetical protein